MLRKPGLVFLPEPLAMSRPNQGRGHSLRRIATAMQRSELSLLTALSGKQRCQQKPEWHLELISKNCQQQLADLVDCSRLTIQAIESGKLRLSERLAQRVWLQTGVSISWLLQHDYAARRSGTGILGNLTQSGLTR